MNTCSRWQNLFADYVDGHLPDGDRRGVDTHLAACPACRARLAEERWLSDRLKQAASESPPERLFVWPPRSAAPRSRTRRRVFAGAVLAVLALVIVGRLPLATDDETISLDSAANTVTSNDDRQLAEMEAAIDREGWAAELAMSAEFLAAEPPAETYAAEAMNLVAEAFPETEAGRDAARRVGSPRRHTRESL